ncbi:MAG: polysaccharide biosynthesis/export family protein [Candidatus Aminicenantes bacterium]|nr:polysaccharide biosynthesis/export family protein [Candidatus Aminicenantes bacterium]
MRLVLAVFLSIFLPLAVFPQAQTLVPTEFRVGPKDVLQIDVYGVDSLRNLEVTISEVGKMTLPLLGEVDVNGLTKSEVEEKLVRLLSESTLRNPQVTVLIKQYQSKVVYLIGAVQKPGVYPLLSRQTLLETIVAAGGPAINAGLEIIVVRKQNGGEGTSLRLSLEDLMIKADARLDIPLQPNDIINIPADREVIIYVLGAVKNPGALTVKLSSVPSLLKAITKAGGFSDRANQGDVRIRRTNPQGVEKEIRVNARDIVRGKKKDVPLEPEDVIIIGESIF